ncbi:MAG: ABC transporter substrate-binding protein [Alphaproteobacteria bacterium]|nr:ABC transporter substrate-binding protein [Alphaproteobacteria bacterium]
MRRHFLRSTLAVAASLWLAAHASAEPLQIVDALGRSVTIQAPVQRVVVNFNFEEFTAVAGKEGWSRVVGMSRSLWEGWRPAIWKRYAEVIPSLAQMPEIGNTEDNNFSAEKIIALKPDVMLMADWTWQSLTTARDQLEAAGIPIVVIDYNAQTLERHLASTRAIGAVMGTRERAEELARLYEHETRDTMRRIAQAQAGGRKPKVLVELARDGAETIGNSYAGTMWGRILDTIGAQNIANGKLVGPWGPLSPEYVIASDPDFVFLAGSSWTNRPKAVRLGYDIDEGTTRRSLEPYAQRAGWAGMAAVRNGEIHAIEHGLGRSLMDFAATQYIAKRLYPERFKDVDPIKSLRDYHARYLPVSFAGVWMLPIKP